MKSNWFSISIDDLIREYGHIHGVVIPVSCVFLDYMEIVILTDDGSNTIEAYLRKLKSEIEIVSLNCGITCCIIKKTANFAELLCRYSRCVMSETKIVSLKDEYEDYSDDSLFNINSWGADLSFRELVTMYDEEELIKPDLQRKYVWSKDEASKFIDSLLLGLPVPSIFLARVNDQKLIIDGYQRIMTVYDYVKGVFSADKKVFKLTNSEAINERWRGKAFAELTKEEQRRISSTTIHAIIFEQKHPANDSGMYKIFERINTSGRNLKPQEIRNCVYHGTFDAALMSMNEYPTWRKLWGDTECDARMTDVEFILRFFALDNLLTTGTALKQISLKKVLNDYMNQYANAGKELLLELQELFEAVVDEIWNALGQYAFRNLTKITERNPEQKFASAIHPAIFDALMIATANERRNHQMLESNGAIDKYKRLLDEDSFIDCITQRTTNVEKIVRRVSLAEQFMFGN